MALETGAHVHIAHSSLARGFEIGRDVPRHGGADHRRGLHPVSLHDRGRHRPAGGKGKCNPPFRTAAEVERMWGCLTRGQDRLCLHRSRAVADRAQDAAGHLRQRRRADRAAELRAADVLAAGGARAAADADGDLLRRARRAMHGLWPKKGAIRVGSDADLCVLERGDFVFDEASDPGPAGDALVALSRAADAGARRRDLAARRAASGMARPYWRSPATAGSCRGSTAKPISEKPEPCPATFVSPARSSARSSGPIAGPRPSPG